MINNNFSIDIEMRTFKRVNSNSKRNCDIKFNKYSIIIINIFIFILLAIYIIEQKKIFLN